MTRKRHVESFGGGEPEFCFLTGGVLKTRVSYLSLEKIEIQFLRPQVLTIQITKRLC